MQAQTRPVRTVEYSTMAYNTLPDVPSAFAAYDRCNGDVLAKHRMKDLFRTHNVQGTLGLVGEPAVWRVNVADGRVIPVEFALEAGEVDWRDLRLQVFVKEFLALLLEHQAHKHFGLCLYPGDGYPGHIEVADGRSTVGLSPDEAHTLPPGELKEVAWFYSNDHLERGCKNYCFDSRQ
ncbi:hypothetical protein LLEC1_06822 [Akanthomyces lecanii]|uniref:Uncharacterized protein n=1 Tax=Cordyceps confragosa TaxID=2714763 RepID=A0A179IK36_CORDF|nr:hypothetical protein LLEC1_06822 [Akanthomyces lecanii]